MFSVRFRTLAVDFNNYESLQAVTKLAAHKLTLDYRTMAFGREASCSADIDRDHTPVRLQQSLLVALKG